MLRTSMARGLGRLADVAVVQAGTVREALRALETLEPAMLLSDLDLPDGSGLEVAAFLEERKLQVPVVFVSAYVNRYRKQLARRSEVEVFEKPIPLERLRSIVEKRLTERVEEAAPFGVADYVQLAAMGRRSVVIDLRGPSMHGHIVIEDGEVLRAVDNRGEGKDAFRRLAFVKSATVRCRALVRGEHVVRNMSGSGESVLLDAAREHDEAGDGLDEAWPAPDDDAARPALGTYDPRRFKELYDEAVEALLAKDYQRAFELFGQARDISPSDPNVGANLARLRAMGFGS